MTKSSGEVIGDIVACIIMTRTASMKLLGEVIGDILTYAFKIIPDIQISVSGYCDIEFI